MRELMAQQERIAELEERLRKDNLVIIKAGRRVTQLEELTVELEKELAANRKSLLAAKRIIDAREMRQMEEAVVAEALDTLESEREANDKLTSELAESQAREAKLEDANRQLRTDCGAHRNRIVELETERDKWQEQYHARLSECQAREANLVRTVQLYEAITTGYEHDRIAAVLQSESCP